MRSPLIQPQTLPGTSIPYIFTVCWEIAGCRVTSNGSRSERWNLCQTTLQGGPPTSYNWVYNSYNYGYKTPPP